MIGYERAVQMLGLRQRSYQSVFAEGGPGHSVLADLAEFCCAFKGDADMSPNELMKMHGRRQVYFRIIDHLRLSPLEIEAVYRNALLARAAAAQRLAATGGDE